MNRFRDRNEAGKHLARELRPYAGSEPLVLALPRGGVPVGVPIAQELRAPLDVWVVRKIGVPWHPELGVGAVAEGGYVYLNRTLIEHVGLSANALEATIELESRQVEDRVRRFRGGRPGPIIQGRTVILTDDGIATGGTVRAAVGSLRRHAPRAIILAVPVASPEALTALELEVDGVYCLRTPSELVAVGLWYADFEQVSDGDVVRLLTRARLELAEHLRSAPEPR